MGFVADLRKFKAKATSETDRIVRETVEVFSDSLVTTTQFNGPWTPYGDPALWKAPPPADYRPGNLRSSWFLSVGAPSTEITDRTDIQRVNGMDRMPDRPAGQRIYLANSAPHAGAIENGHSSQAPVGVLVNAAEFEPVVRTVAARRP